MAYTANDNGTYVIPLIDFGERLRDNFGLTIREHPHFDPVDDVHAAGSHHYNNNAIDIQDWRDDVIDGVDWRTRTGNLETALQGSGVEVIGPNSGVAGHDTHLHLAGFDGNIHLNEDQYQYFFGGGAGANRSLFTLQPGAVGDGGNGAPNGDRGGAKERAQNYSEMSKAQLDSAYDKLRGGDTNQALSEGMKMHKAYFKKP
jgi:hypothetical protein